MEICEGTKWDSHEAIVVDNGQRCPLCEAIRNNEENQTKIEELEKQVSDREEEIASLRMQLREIQEAK